jgi:hypothetical protein
MDELKRHTLFVVLVLFVFFLLFCFFFCAVMSIRSFKLDFYIFALSNTCICLQTVFYLVSIVVLFLMKQCTFCRELYIYIYICTFILIKTNINTDSFFLLFMEFERKRICFCIW